MSAAQVVSVNVGRAHGAAWAGRLRRTAIDKRPVPGRVQVGPLGLAGDEQADRRHHGGVDQAVYVYAREDLDRWAERLGRALRDGMFGENLTTAGLDLTGAFLGERWRAGTVLLEIASPRIPCGVFRNWMAETGWVRRFTAEGRPGAYLRVLAEGSIQAGDAIAVVHRPRHGVTLADAFRALSGNRPVPERVRRTLERRDP